MLVMNRVFSEEDSELHAGENRLNLTRKSVIEVDEVSGTSAMLRRRKQPKITLFSSPNSKMNWTKDEELIILKGILDFQNVGDLSYKADSDAFLLYIKDFMNVKFSKEQLMRKIRKLKTRFENNIEKFDNGEYLKFSTTSDDYEVFKLSNLLWGQNKDQFAAPVHINQPNDGASIVDHTTIAYTVMETEKENGGNENGALVVEPRLVTCTVMENEKEKENGGKENEALVEKKKEKHKEKEKKEKENGALVEHTPVSYTDMEKEKEKQEKKKKKKKKKEKMKEKVKVKEKENGAFVEHVLVSYTIDMEKEKDMEMEKNGGKEDSEEEWCDLEDAFEATLFKNLSKYHQKLMLQSLRNIGADKRKEFRNEWKALLVEEVELNIKKQAFSAKLVNAHLCN